MNIVERRLEELHPYQYNPRKNDYAVDAVASSIAEFGFKVPIVIDKNNVIVTGHTRYKAADILGMDTVPCIIADDLTDEQIRAFRLADNKVSEIAEWDFKLLDIELSEIVNIDMSEFGFELNLDDSGDDEGYYGDARERTFEKMNLTEYDASRVVGKYDFPIVEAETYIPKDIISFNYLLTSKEYDKGIHFFIDDYQFERLWTSPQEYIPKLAQFDCVIAPDYSTYRDMPIAMQIWNVYRNRLLTQMMQDYGIKVIPCASWTTENSYEFMFDGLPKNSVLATETVGIVRDEEGRELWFKGMTETIKRLEPIYVVIYGKDIGYDFGGIPHKYIENHNTESFSERVALNNAKE